MRVAIRGCALVLSVALLGTDGVNAQQNTSLEEVKAINQAFYEAASARDLTKMESLWAYETYVRAVHPGRPIDQGWQPVQASSEDLFERYSKISVGMPDPHLRIVGEAAWVTGEERFEGVTGSGEEASATLLGTSVYEKTGGAWRMVHHHGSVLPPPAQD